MAKKNENRFKDWYNRTVGSSSDSSDGNRFSAWYNSKYGDDSKSYYQLKEEKEERDYKAREEATYNAALSMIATGKDSSLTSDMDMLTTGTSKSSMKRQAASQEANKDYQSAMREYRSNLASQTYNSDTTGQSSTQYQNWKQYASQKQEELQQKRADEYSAITSPATANNYQQVDDDVYEYLQKNYKGNENSFSSVLKNGYSVNNMALANQISREFGIDTSEARKIVRAYKNGKAYTPSQLERMKESYDNQTTEDTNKAVDYANQIIKDYEDLDDSTKELLDKYVSYVPSEDDSAQHYNNSVARSYGLDVEDTNPYEQQLIDIFGSKEALDQYVTIYNNQSKAQSIVDYNDLVSKAQESLSSWSDEDLADLDDVINYNKTQTTNKLYSDDAYSSAWQGIYGDVSGEKSDIDSKAARLSSSHDDYDLIYQYREMMNDKEATEEFNNDIDSIMGSGIVGNAAANVADVLASPMAVFGTADILKQKAEGKDFINTYNSANLYSNFDTNVMNTENEMIEDVTSGFGTDAAEFGYGVANSTLKSAYSMLIGGGVTSSLGLSGTAAKVVANAVTLPMFGSSAFNSTYQQEIDRGLSPDMALSDATLNGTFEMLFEVVSLDKGWDIINDASKASLKHTIASMIVQAGIEGSEEGATDLADWYADQLTEGQFSEFAQTARDYEAQGMSAEEAYKQACNDFWKQVGLDAAAGALSGLVMGAGESYVSSKKTNRLAQTVIDEGRVEDVVEAAKLMPQDSTAYKIATSKSIEDISLQDLSKIIESAQGVASNEDTIKSIVVSAYAEENGISKRKAEKIYNSWVSGENVDETTEENTDALKQLADETAGVTTSERLSQLSEEAYNKTPGQNTLGEAYTAKKISDIKKDISKNSEKHSQEYAKKSEQSARDYFEKNGSIATGTDWEGRQAEIVKINSIDNGSINVSYKSGDKYFKTSIKNLNFDGKDKVYDAITKLNSSIGYGDVNAANRLVKEVLATDNESSIDAIIENGLQVYDSGMALQKYESYEQLKADDPTVAAMEANTSSSFLAEMFSLGENQNKALSEFMNIKDGSATYTGKDSTGHETTSKLGTVTYTDNNIDMSYEEKMADPGITDEEKEYLEIGKRVAEALNIHVVVTNLTSMKENGAFVPSIGKLFVNIDSNNSAIATIMHELSEFGKAYNTTKMNNFVSEVLAFISSSEGAKYLNDSLKVYFDAYMRNGEAETLRTVGDEFVFDAMGGIFMQEGGMEAFNEFLDKNVSSESKRKGIKETLLDILNAIVDAFKKAMNLGSVNSGFKSGLEMDSKKAEEFRNKWMDIIQEAKENFSEQVENSIENKEYSDKDGNVIDGNRAMLSLNTFDSRGRMLLDQYLQNEVDAEELTKEDKVDFMAQMETIYQMCKDFAEMGELVDFASWCDTEIVYKNGKPMVSVVVNNGEYKLNIDMSTVCKKRKTLDRVINTLVRSGDLNLYTLTQKDINTINEVIKKHELEIACAMCFVDTKRYRVGAWADSFADPYNKMIKSLVPKGSDIKIDEFNYTGRDVKNPTDNLLKNADDSELDWKYVDKIAKQYSGKALGRYANAIKEHKELRSLLNSSDFIASAGLDKIRIENPTLYELINSHGGTSKPKLSHSEVPYNSDVLTSSKFTPEAAYAVGGVRVQSFSDYMANMFFDYANMVADFSAKKLPCHSYSKVESYARIFGLTGIKINLSILPKGAVLTQAQIEKFNKMPKTQKVKDKEYIALSKHAGLDEDGNYIFDDESFDWDTAMDIIHTEGYDKNVGTIVVGVSSPHIWKLLSDPNVSMVIPYHKSSLNPVIARLRNIDFFTDYTKKQNTRYRSSGKKILKTSPQFDFYEDLAKTNDPIQTCNNYLDYCDENNFIPKFDEFAYNEDGSRNENYYKLIIDFRVYDDQGNYAPQQAVQMKYPENLNSLVLDSLKDAQKTSNKTDAKMESIMIDVRSALNEGKGIDVRHSVDVHNISDDFKYKLPREIQGAIIEDGDSIENWEIPQSIENMYKVYNKETFSDDEYIIDVAETRYHIFTFKGKADNLKIDKIILKGGKLNGSYKKNRRSDGSAISFVRDAIQESKSDLYDAENGQAETSIYGVGNSDESDTIGEGNDSEGDRTRLIFRTPNNFGSDGIAKYFDSLYDANYSINVTDSKTLDFLNNQDYVTTYKTMRKIGEGQYVSPMATKINGKYEMVYNLGGWAETVEHPELMKVKVREDGKDKYYSAIDHPELINEDESNLYFKLAKGKNGEGKSGSIDARYNPYEHSSNSVFNDQFDASYKEPSFVTVEMHIPKSELTSGYRAKYAKDPVGFTQWKAGSVSNALAKSGKEARGLYLSRWAMPFRELPSSEVAAKYVDAISGTDVKIGWNTVTPDVLRELQKIDAPIDYSIIAKGGTTYEDAYPSVRHSINVGYHAGDLGKSESLGQQSGGRGTGHFGTGTYFVGNRSRIEGYNDRDGVPSPKETVDFSKYNLFRPLIESDADTLHEFLSGVNNFRWMVDSDIKSERELDDLKDYIDDKMFEYEDSDEIIEMEILGNIERFLDGQTISKAFAKYGNFGEYKWLGDDGLYTDKGNLKTFDDLLSEMDFDSKYDTFAYLRKEMDEHYRTRNIDNFEYWNNNIFKAAFVLGVDKGYLETLVYDVWNEVNNFNGDPYTADSASTRLMKALGYEGVDVRNIAAFDNTRYGSVIYDLKDEDLQRKKDIGTAKFSINVPSYGDVYFSDSTWDSDLIDSINSEERWNDGSTTISEGKYLLNAIDILKEGTSLVKSADLDQKNVTKVARAIKKKWNSSIKLEDLTDSLTKAFSYMNRRETSHEAMMGIMEQIAKQVINQAQETAEVDATYKAVKDYLKNTSIKLNDQQIQNVAYAYGSYNDFRKQNFGRIKLSNNGIELDSIWGTLSDLSGNALDVSISDADQPKALMEYLDGAIPVAVNPYHENMEQAAIDCAMDIFGNYYYLSSLYEADAKAKQKILNLQKKLENEINKYRESTKANYNKAVAEEYKIAEERKNQELKRMNDLIAQLKDDENQALNVNDETTQALLTAQRIEYENRLEQLKKQNTKKIAQINAHNRTIKANARVRRESTELKAKVRSNVNALNRMLTSPNVNQAVTRAMVNPLIDVLESINLDTGRSKAMSDKLGRLAEVYDRYRDGAKEEKQLDYDERIAGMIKDLKAIFEGRNYTEISNDELQKVIEITTAIRKQIQNANRLLQNERAKDTFKAARTVVKEVEASKGVTNKFMEKLNNYNTWQLSAYNEFRKLANYDNGSVWMGVYNELLKGELTQIEFQRQANNIFAPATDGKENQKAMKDFTSTKDLVDIGLKDDDGNPVLVTKAMRMSVIFHSQNESNLRHLLGGVTVPVLSEYEKGNMGSAWGRNSHTYYYVSKQTRLEYAQAKAEAARHPDDESAKAKLEAASKKQEQETWAAIQKINSLSEDLSEWEKKFYESAELFFHEFTGKEINKVTEQVRGYAVARVKNYYPIKTDPDFTRTDFSKLIMDASLEGWGNLKERIVSSNPLLLEDITNVALRQIDKTSRYIGFAVPIRDWNMMMKTTFYEDGTNRSIKNSIRKTWGDKDVDFLENLVQDLSGGRTGKREDFERIAMKFRGNFAGATLTANVGVGMKQFSSFPTAGAVVGNRVLLQAMKDIPKGFTNKGIPELEAINPLLWTRGQGNASTELAYAKKSDLYKAMPNFVKATTIDLIQNIDLGTVRTLEYAAKIYVDKYYKDLEKGSTDYWNKVSETFTAIVTRTQPNYTTLERPDILRSPDTLLKNIVMFKTQPLQNFGIIYDAIGELNAKSRLNAKLKTEASKAELSEAKRHLFHAISSQIISAMVFSAMTIAANLFYHKWWKYDKDDDKDMKEEMLIGWATGMMSNFFGMLTFGDVIYQLIDKFALGGTYYGVSAPVEDMVNDLVENAGNIQEYAEAMRTSTNDQDLEKNRLYLIDATNDLATNLLQFVGVPLTNIENTLKAMWLYGSEGVKTIQGEDVDVVTDDVLSPYDVQSHDDYLAEVAQNAYDAMVSGDKNSYDEYWNELVENSTSQDRESSADNKVMNILKEAYINGDVSDSQAKKYLDTYFGISDTKKQETKLNTWKNGTSTLKNTMKDSIDAYINSETDEYGDINSAVKAYVNSDDGSQASLISYIRSKYKTQYLKATKKEKIRIKSAVLQALRAGGVSESEIKSNEELDWLN